MSLGTTDDREEARLGALRDLNLLDTPESEGFDRITRMASRLFDAPIAAVSLTDRDRQWFKSHVGTAGREIPREKAPCAAVALSASALVIPDMLRDPFFAESLLARSGIRFYAGAPLVTREGHALGAMCVLDKEPRTASEDQVAALRDFAAMVMAQVELERDFGRIEPLSGLPNRNQLEDDLRDLARAHPGAPRVNLAIEVADARQIGEMSSVLGPSCVDDLVKASSRRVKDALGSRAAGLYHTGTAAYLLVLDEAETGPWRGTMERLADGLRRPIACNGVPIAVDAVFGASPFRLGESGPRDALRSAVSAAGDARAAALGHAVYSPASDEANRRRFHLLADMREALARPGQLRLAYQPRVDARTGACLGAEALLRWRHPRFGEVSPGEFMPLVEQTALARPATAWVVDAALDQLAAWRRAGVGLRASVNVSANNLREPDFARRVAEALERRALPAAAVELELTESALIGGDGGRVLEQLGLLKAMGVEIAIDDFGTGYSTFAYLRTVPADTVKLDRSFVQPLASDEKARRLVSSMIEMAHGLGFRVVAEGVETRAELDFLVACGCEEAQGYLFCRPVDPARLEGWLADRAAPGRPS